MLEKKAVAAVGDVRSKCLTQMTDSLRATAQQYHMRVARWMVEMESAMRAKLKDDITRHSKLFVQVRQHQHTTYTHSLSLTHTHMRTHPPILFIV